MNLPVRLYCLFGATFLVFAVVPALSSPIAGQSEQTVVDDFFQYLLKQKTDIATDSSAQEKWLTAKLRTLLVESTKAVTEARKLPEINGPDPMVPDNSEFLASWDSPTTCHASKPSRTTPQTLVRVLCRWGLTTNYPGTTRSATVSLEMEAGAWRISDIQFHKSKYAGENNLLQRLELLRDTLNKPRFLAAD